MTTNVTLRDGTVLRCRPVPPHAAIAIRSEYTLPQPPQLPMKQVQSKAGHTEPLPIGPGDEGWEEFIAAREKWQVEYNELNDEIIQREAEFVLDYAVQAWKQPGDEEWREDAPEDWEFPAVLKRHEIAPSENPRLDFIKYELLQTADAVRQVQEVAVDNTRPLSREEVSAARGKFRAEKQARRRRLRSAETGRGRYADLQHDDVPRDEGGKGIRSLARRLVQAIKG